MLVTRQIHRSDAIAVEAERIGVRGDRDVVMARAHVARQLRGRQRAGGRRGGGGGLAIVGVDMREEPAEVQAFTQGQGYDWLVGIDADVQVRNRYNTVGIPNHVFVDAQGIVRAISLGHLTAPAMESALATIIDQ